MGNPEAFTMARISAVVGRPEALRASQVGYHVSLLNIVGRAFE
jgi:hypothetical protein